MLISNLIYLWFHKFCRHNYFPLCTFKCHYTHEYNLESGHNLSTYLTPTEYLFNKTMHKFLHQGRPFLKYQAAVLKKTYQCEFIFSTYGISITPSRPDFRLLVWTLLLGNASVGYKSWPGCRRLKIMLLGNWSKLDSADLWYEINGFE